MSYDYDYEPRTRRPRYEDNYSRREGRFWPYLRSRSGETWAFFVVGLFLGSIFL